MATWYAWSPIVYGTEKDQKGNFLRNKTVKVGEEVSKSKLGLSDDDWDALVESRAIRKTAHPDMGDFSGSPVEWFREQARRAQSGGSDTTDDEDVEEEDEEEDTEKK